MRYSTGFPVGVVRFRALMTFGNCEPISLIYGKSYWIWNTKLGELFGLIIQLMNWKSVLPLKMNGLPLNRAVYSEPENVEMSYPQLKAHFRQAEKERNHTTGYIVFTDDSFDKPYTEEQRTYVVSSNNKAFIEGMGGYSIYASSLDGSDKCVRLEAYMADEHGGKDGWKIEKCYVKDDSNREMLDIIAGKFFIAYAPIESEKFLSMPKELARKYEEKFKYPERFYKSLDGIEAKPYKPVSKDMER